MWCSVQRVGQAAGSRAPALPPPPASRGPAKRRPPPVLAPPAQPRSHFPRPHRPHRPLDRFRRSQRPIAPLARLCATQPLRVAPLHSARGVAARTLLPRSPGGCPGTGAAGERGCSEVRPSPSATCNHKARALLSHRSHLPRSAPPCSTAAAPPLGSRRSAGGAHGGARSCARVSRGQGGTGRQPGGPGAAAAAGALCWHAARRLQVLAVGALHCRGCARARLHLLRRLAHSGPSSCSLKGPRVGASGGSSAGRPCRSLQLLQWHALGSGRAAEPVSAPALERAAGLGGAGWRWAWRWAWAWAWRWQAQQGPWQPPQLPAPKVPRGYLSVCRTGAAPRSAGVQAAGRSPEHLKPGSGRCRAVCCEQTGSHLSTASCLTLLDAAESAAGSRQQAAQAARLKCRVAHTGPGGLGGMAMLWRPGRV